MRHPKAILTIGCLFLASTPARGESAQVWLAGDDIRIGPSTLPLDDSLLTSGRGFHLFALRGETVAFQIAIRSGKDPLGNVTVELDPSPREGGIRLQDSWVERFVSFAIPSYGETRNGFSDIGETLGWVSADSKPSSPSLHIPDALIPVEHAPSWAAYPLRLPPQTTASIWIDIFIPEDAPGGQYHANIHIGDGLHLALEVPLVIEVKAARLPFRAAKTAVFYDALTLEERIGKGPAELELWRMLHRHHLTPMLSADDEEELQRIHPAIDGSAFRPEAGYLGPGANIGDDVVALGAYGSLGEPNEAALTRIFNITYSLPSSSRAVSYFLYAIDERCDSDRAARWRRLLRATGDPLLIAMRVGETCHLRAPGRIADIIMVPSAAFRIDESREARAAGKWLWVYNGQRPRSGPLTLDASPLDLRANGWIASAFDVDRWFYWESIFWNDSNSGGHGPIDPFATAETFHNAGGDVALGDGLLLYPGRQLGFPTHSIGIDKVLPSIRLKNLRRGIQDAGYVALVASREPELAERIVRRVIPLALDELATDRSAPTWQRDPSAFIEGRLALWNAIPSDLGLDEIATKDALDQVAKLRRRKVQRSAEGQSRQFAVAMLTGVAAAWLLRRHRSHRSSVALSRA